MRVLTESSQSYSKWTCLEICLAFEGAASTWIRGVGAVMWGSRCADAPARPEFCSAASAHEGTGGFACTSGVQSASRLVCQVERGAQDSEVLYPSDGAPRHHWDPAPQPWRPAPSLGTRGSHCHVAACTELCTEHPPQMAATAICPSWPPPRLADPCTEHVTMSHVRYRDRPETFEGSFLGPSAHLGSSG